jgi:hypothetical protein
MDAERDRHSSHADRGGAAPGSEHDTA